MPYGLITITFYVNDTLGNTGFKNIVVVKDSSEQVSGDSPPDTFDPNELLTSTVGLFTIGIALGLLSGVVVIMGLKVILNRRGLRNPRSSKKS